MSKENREIQQQNDLPIDTIINGECIETMRNLPDACVDLIIADPPYNLSKGGDWKWDNSVSLAGMGGNWNKVMQTWDDYTLESYFAFTYAWLQEAKRILKPTGSMWILIPIKLFWRYQLWRSITFQLTKRLKQSEKRRGLSQLTLSELIGRSPPISAI
jgi:DNA modification methylase